MKDDKSQKTTVVKKADNTEGSQSSENVVVQTSATAQSNDNTATNANFESPQANLFSELKKVSLNPDKWLKHLNDECGVTEHGQIQFLDTSDLKKLQKHVDLRWESKALNKLLGIEELSAETKKNRVTQAEKLLVDLKALTNNRGNATDELVKQKVQDLKTVFNISDKDWNREMKNESIESVIGRFSSQLGQLSQFATGRKQLTPQELLQKSSGGLVLKGILMTQDVSDCIESRRAVIEVPEVVELKSPLSQQIDDTKDFSERSQLDQFNKSLDTMGYKIAAGAKYGRFGFQAEVGLSNSHHKEKKEESESHEGETYLSKVITSYVPTAVCELDGRELKFSESLLMELKELERLVQTTGIEEVKQKCEAILMNYGSHINVRHIEFGGIYQWQATYSSEASSSKEKAQSMITDALDGLGSLTIPGSDLNAGGTLLGNRVKSDGSLTARHKQSDSSNITMNSSKKGGPQEIATLAMWKMGLVEHNDTWAVIDRSSKLREFTGIWELIRNNSREFTDAGKLADTLEKAWESMTGCQCPSSQGTTKIEDAVKSLDEVLQHVTEWVKDPTLSTKADEYLRILLKPVQGCYLATGNSKVWLKELRDNTKLSDFLRQVMDIKGEYSESNLTHVCYHLKELSRDIVGYFPLKTEILRWASQENTEMYDGQDVMKVGTINDIPSLISAIKVSLLPITAGNESEPSIQATKQLALAVNNLVEQLNEEHVLLLMVSLHELAFDSHKKDFDVMVTNKSLLRFSEDLAKLWEGLCYYTQYGSMRKQAFLLHCLVESLVSSRDPQDKEGRFNKFLLRLPKPQEYHIQRVISLFEHSSAYDWDNLLLTLKELMKGNIPKPETIEISLLRKISNSNKQNDESPNPPATTAIQPAENTDAGYLLKHLGLTDYYPSKISLQDVMALGTKRCMEDGHLTDLPWIILQKLIMLDYNGRDKAISDFQEKASEKPSDDSNEFTWESIRGDTKSAEIQLVSLNPQDIFITVYACCDMILQQVLVQKMFMCRLAVPLICPELLVDSFVFSLWALRGIIVDWKIKDQSLEGSVMGQSLHIVSFLRLGKPSSSKSTLMNNVLSDQAHHTFWSRDCPLGLSDRKIANGLVEAQWYLPSGEETDTFRNVTMLLNLRGDANVYKEQVKFLQKVSNVIVCLIEVNDVENPVVLEAMKSLHDSSLKVVFFLCSESQSPEQLNAQLQECANSVQRSNLSKSKIIAPTRGNTLKTIVDLREDLRKVIGSLLKTQDGKSIKQASELAKDAGFDIDEDNEYCMIAKTLADEVISKLGDKTTNECKLEMLPLHQNSWHELSKLLKEKYRIGKHSKSLTIYEKDHIDERMTKLRQSQLSICQNVNPMMQTFLVNLVKIIESQAGMIYLQWLKLHFDEMSRKTLPGQHGEYHEKWKRFSSSKSKGDSEKTHKLKKDLVVAESKLAEASLGLEHLLREIAQIYEAAIESKCELEQLTRQGLENLANIAAKMLLRGQPLEIMDGDAANVPLTWVKAVFSSLDCIIGNKKLFVISVLGVQSSGKSTLLNTMFGFQFSVSAGRCTRGVYMQLTKVDKGRSDLPYDYVLVVDTEGLHAPELGQIKYRNDNQLATFVIGLGDVTILNIKGENMAEMSDVLQIAVHAFLRMKLTNQKNRTCVFIHQNVSAIDAKEKMKQSCQKLQDNLDEMTAEACSVEDILDVHTFNDVIEFDGESNVWYFSDLWHGDPPMAPANPGYSKKVQNVKEYILNNLKLRKRDLLTFTDMKLRIQDLWKGVLSENFVFSFRNSLAAKAYRDLEVIYNENSWNTESRITDMIIKTGVKLEKCTTVEDLDHSSTSILADLKKHSKSFMDQAISNLEHFFENHDLQEILSQWKKEKMLSMESDTSLFLSRARREILRKKNSRRIDIMQQEHQEKHKKEIKEKAKNQATEFKGQNKTEEQIRGMFDMFWPHLVVDFVDETTAAPIPYIEDTVKQTMEAELSNEVSLLAEELEKTRLKRDLKLYKLKGSMHFEDIEETDISLAMNRSRKYVDKACADIFDTDEHILQCRRIAVDTINDILGTVDQYLEEIHDQGTGFQESYAKKVIRIIVNGVKTCNEEHRHPVKKNKEGGYEPQKELPESQKDSGGRKGKKEDHSANNIEQTNLRFTLKPQLLVKTAVHACFHATKVFQKIQRDYDEKHNIKKKLEAYKKEIFSLFKNTIKQSQVEITAADLLINQMEELLMRGLTERVQNDIVNDMVNRFAANKYHLLIDVLRHLPDKGFHAYKTFIKDGKNHCFGWIRTCTDEQFFGVNDGKHSTYAMCAKRHIQSLAAGLTESIAEATRCVTERNGSEQNTSNIVVWVEQFCDNQQDLPFTVKDLELFLEQEVHDFVHMEKLLLKGLHELEDKVFKTFKNETAGSIHWEGKPPHEKIMDKLWGCDAQCPFCNEPCQSPNPNHLSPNDCHQCIQHRPSGVNGVRDAKSEVLCVESCNFDIQSDRRFRYGWLWECKDSGTCSGKEYHPCREYKKFLPDWDIAPSPNMESSKYWMWVMATYKHQLADMYTAKSPDIPAAWDQITKQEALDSLCVSYS